MDAYPPTLDGTDPPAPPAGAQDGAERLAIEYLRGLDLLQPHHKPIVAQVLELAPNDRSFF